MAYYNRRDRLQHWVRKDQPTQQHCTHACCRGYQEHPKHWPVIPERRALRRASDYELASHFARVSRGRTAEHRTAEMQVLAEMQRRDDQQRDRELRKQQRREAVAANRAAAQMDREAAAHAIRMEAEAATGGYLVNPQGRARGISDAEILTGREDVFIRYATREAKDFFAERPRPTAAYLRYGRDTRVKYSDRPTRRRRLRVA